MISEEVEPTENKKTVPEPPSSFSSLPDEIAVNCLARISKSYYPRISLVSKAFRSLISSRELHTERSRIGTTEICGLCMCLNYSTIVLMLPSGGWFSLWDWEKPKGKGTDHSPPPPISPSTVTAGSKIYLLGGPVDDDFSSAVWVYDCWSDTWRDLPNMKMERVHASSCVLDDKIYVMGGCMEHESWFEMFDVKTQTWKTLPNPEIRLENKVRKISGAGGKIYVKTETGVKDWIYDVKESKWSVADEHLSRLWSRSWCVIDNVLYTYYYPSYMWYDLESSKWKAVRGLGVLREYRGYCVRNNPNPRVELVNYGGKLAIVWDRFNQHGKRKIWCAVVALERSHAYGGEVWGKIEWVDVVLTVPKSYSFLRCLAISV